MAINFLVSSIVFFALAPLKIFHRVQVINDFLIAHFLRVGHFWSGFNNFIINTTLGTKWIIRSNEKDLKLLSPSEWYFLVANHQSSTDILVLQKVFSKKIPFLKFFIKKELIWVPLLGQCWWLLDFPFLERNRKRKDTKDLKTLKKTTEQSARTPTSIFCFPEGTRLTHKKNQDLTKSPYSNLLKPRAGGFGLVLETLGTKVKGRLLDITIHYTSQNKSLFDFFFGRVEKIIVDVKIRALPAELLGGDELIGAKRERLYEYLNNLWKEKDELLSELKRDYPIVS